MTEIVEKKKKIKRDVREEIQTIKFYYLRDSKNVPRFTRCLILRKNGTVGIGTAMCLPTDNPDRSIGRKYAYNRAMSAVFSQKNVADKLTRDSVIENYHVSIPETVGLPFKFKGIFVSNPHRLATPLSEYEYNILFREKGA